MITIDKLCKKPEGSFARFIEESRREIMKQNEELYQRVQEIKAAQAIQIAKDCGKI